MSGAEFARLSIDRSNNGFSFQAICDLGVVVYAALDYGLDSETERRLSDDLEELLQHMDAAGERFTQMEAMR